LHVSIRWLPLARRLPLDFRSNKNTCPRNTLSLKTELWVLRLLMASVFAKELLPLDSFLQIYYSNRQLVQNFSQSILCSPILPSEAKAEPSRQQTRSSKDRDKALCKPHSYTSFSLLCSYVLASFNHLYTLKVSFTELNFNSTSKCIWLRANLA
jgi:hypothetical protein